MISKVRVPLSAQVIRIGIILGGLKNKVKATGAIVCAGTKNQALVDFSSVKSGHNNKAEGEYSSIPCGRNNKVKGKGSIYLVVITGSLITTMH